MAAAWAPPRRAPETRFSDVRARRDVRCWVSARLRRQADGIGGGALGRDGDGHRLDEPRRAHAQAFPPAYTEHIGGYLMLEVARAGRGVTRLARSRYDEALEWLLICSTWWGGHLRVRLGRQPPHQCCWRRWRDPGQFGDLPGLVRALDEGNDDEILLGMPVGWRGSQHADVVSMLWARVEGEKQLAFAKAHRPLPSMILQEGTSTRRWLIWMLEETIRWARAKDYNRRLAYAFRACRSTRTRIACGSRRPGAVCGTVGSARSRSGCRASRSTRTSQETWPPP